MTQQATRGGLVINDLEPAREALLAENPVWPDAEAVDAAGIQLIVSAMRSGLEPPEAIRTAPEVQRLWRDLGLDTALPLQPGPARN